MPTYVAFSSTCPHCHAAARRRVDMERAAAMNDTLSTNALPTISIADDSGRASREFQTSVGSAGIVTYAPDVFRVPFALLKSFESST